MRQRFSTAILPVSLLLLCCGPAADRTESPSSSVGAAPSAAPATPGSQVDFSEADLAAWEQGMREEIELVQAARKRADTASTPEGRAAAGQAEWEDQTAPEAARTVGMDPARYREIREAVTGVFETLDFQGKIDGPMELDTTRATPELKARLTADPFAGLTPGAAAALRARLDRLTPVWIEYAGLTALHG